MRRLAIDTVFAVALVAAGVVAVRAWLDDGPPETPAGVCLSDGATARPRLELLAADGRITIAALFAQMAEGRLRDDDHGTWSLRRFVAELEAAGFRRTGAERYERTLAGGTQVVIDVLGPASLPREERAPTIGRALERAIADHEIVYYNGGAYGGALSGLRRAWPEYRILILDSCWSLQLYGRPLVDSGLDVVVNRERAITGSVASFAPVLRELVEPPGARPTWASLLATMNHAARRRAAGRLLHPRFRAAEHYGLAVRCAARGSG
jgi:hypothetical protein